MKKGFILLTTMIITFAVAFIAISLLSYNQISSKKLNTYYQNAQEFYDQDSQRSQQLFENIHGPINIPL